MIRVAYPAGDDWGDTNVSTTAQEFQFSVPGRPVPAVRMTQRSKWMNPQAKRYIAYREQVGWAARLAGAEPIDGPIMVRIDVYLKNRMGRRGDIDNLAKSLTDGINGICYYDDKQITSLNVKLWDTTGEEHVDVWIGATT